MTEERSFLLDELGDPSATKGSKLWSLYASNEMRKSFYVFQQSGTSSRRMTKLFKEHAGWQSLGFSTWEDFSKQALPIADEGDPGAEKGSKLWSLYVAGVINESRQEFEQSSAHLSEMAAAFKEHAGWLSLGLDSWDKFCERYFFGQEAALNEAIAASAKKIAPVDGLAWLAEQGAMFALPKGRTKSKFDAGWQNNPRSLDDANKHAKSGGNVGVLTGKHSGGIVAIDRDVDFPQTCEMLGQYAKTAKIARSNAKERGKLLYRIIGELPPSAMWKADPTDKHPACEFLSTGRHALAPTSTFDGGEYMLFDAEYGIQELTVIELDYIWRMITGESIHKDIADAEAAQAETQVATEKAAVEKVAGSNEYVSAVKTAWTSKQIFEHFKRATHGTKKSGKDTRILGNAGLLVMPNDNKWYCHADGVGGGPLEAWAYCKWNKKYDHKMFWDVINDMATAAGIVQPERKTKVYTNGNGNHAEPMPSVEYTKSSDEMETNEAPQANEPEPKVKEINAKQMLLKEGAHDEGNAQCVHVRYKGKFLHSESLGWLVHTGTHWTMDEAEAKVERAITETLIARLNAAIKEELSEDRVKKFIPNSGRVQGAKSQLRSLVSVVPEKFDIEADYLNCKNGVVDLRTGEVIEHSPGQRFMHCTAVNYNPTASQDLWWEWLISAVGLEMADWLQIAVGYTLTGHTREEIMFYLFGPPRSGKGTFTETLLNLLGSPLAKEVGFSMFLAQRTGDSQNFDLAPLKPCRFVAASESNSYERFNEAKIKALTGGNEVYCAFKHKTHFGYKPQFKIWLSSNQPINADPDDEAVWGRLRVVEFPISHLGNEDKSLKYNMRSNENLEGVLAWAVDGAKRWYALGTSGLPEVAGSAKTKQTHRSELDNVQAWIEECCEKADAFCAYSSLYYSYETWCKNNGVEPKKQKGFSQSLIHKGYQTKTVRVENSTKKGFIGLILR